MPDDMPVPLRPSVDRLIGTRLKTRREELNRSLSALAKKTSVPIDHLEAIEAGTVRPSAALLVDICAAIDLRIGSLFADLDLSTAQKTSCR